VVEKRIQKEVQSLINTWTTEIDGDIPVQFSDSLALGLFASTISSMCKRYYILGKKEQKRKHKQRACKRHHENT